MESNSGYPEKYMNDGELVGKTKVIDFMHVMTSSFAVSKITLCFQHVETLSQLLVNLGIQYKYVVLLWIQDCMQNGETVGSRQ